MKHRQQFPNHLIATYCDTTHAIYLFFKKKNWYPTQKPTNLIYQISPFIYGILFKVKT